MRSIQIIMLTLCIVSGLYLLIQAPVFFMPNRWDPHTGYLLTPVASRLLGAGLLAVAWTGWNYLRYFYYEQHKPSIAAQYCYFLSLLAALILIGSAFWKAETVPPSRTSTRTVSPPAFQSAEAAPALLYDYVLK